MKQKFTSSYGRKIPTTKNTNMPSPLDILPDNNRSAFGMAKAKVQAEPQYQQWLSSYEKNMEMSYTKNLTQLNGLIPKVSERTSGNGRVLNLNSPTQFLGELVRCCDEAEQRCVWCGRG